MSSRAADGDAPTTADPGAPAGSPVHEPTREMPEHAAGTAAAVPPARRGGPEADEPGAPVPVRVVEPAGRRIGRALFILAGVIALIAALLVGARAVGVWPHLDNPFTGRTTDRSQPVLLKSMRDLSRYVAAEGDFQVVVDLQHNRRYVPDFLLSERTLFVGAGGVEAFVDFGKLADGAVTVSPDGKSVQVTLPAPQLDGARLDLGKSYVFAEKRGALNVLRDVFAGDPNREKEVYLLAQQRIDDAARQSGLAERAQTNTRKMIEGLLHSLGYTAVTVAFTQP